MIVDIDHLTVTFRRPWRRARFKALDDVTFDVREGDFFALLGPNGAGKSTMMYCLLGLLRPTAGTVRVFGEPLTLGCPAFGRIAYLPEEPHYHDYLTVEEAVTYYARLFGAAPERRRVLDVLDRLGLGRHGDARVATCSKGMKQKVGIAQCLLHEPRLLVLDEPMRGLDPVTVKEFRDVLVDLNQRGVTVIMNSHLLAEVELVATRAAILDRGRLVTVASMNSLVREEPHQYAIEIDRLDPLPPFFTTESTVNGRVRGTIPAERLYDLMDEARAAGARVSSCSLKRSSLEASFLAAVQAGGDRA